MSSNNRDWSRREFLRGGSLSTAMALLGGVEIVARGTAETVPAAEPGSAGGRRLGCAVVGLGRWGRELVGTLSRLPQVELVAVCDHYPSSLRRGRTLAPEAKQVEDARELLTDPAVQAVFLATPSHQHRELALAALQAGRHLYCEAPLATTLEDAAAIARAARAAAPRVVFRAGLQSRSDPQRRLAAGFVAAGVVGKPVMAQAQWHRKQSWRQAAATPDRKEEVNWRLDARRSLGLPGEVAIHHLDAMTWFLGARPLSVSGAGSIRLWGDDGRDVADTVHLELAYPEGIRLAESCTLASSLGAESEALYGSDATVLFREGRGWLFKEVDAPILGWEVHARKEVFQDQTGLVLVANASKQKASEGVVDPVEAILAVPPLHHALEAFVQTALDIEAATEDFTGAYGTDDPGALGEHLATVPQRPGAGWQEGYEALVIAAKAQEAVRTGQRIEFQPEWFELT